MYVRHEAVLSSQIEGTQSTLEDVLEYEIDVVGATRPKDVQEVVNYVRAMNHGLIRLKEFPLSLRLIREITGQQRNRVFRYEPYMHLFDQQALTLREGADQGPTRTTRTEATDG